MDEEDLAAMKEEQKLETKEGFGVEGKKGKGRAGTDERFVVFPRARSSHFRLVSSSSPFLPPLRYLRLTATSPTSYPISLLPPSLESVPNSSPSSVGVQVKESVLESPLELSSFRTPRLPSTTESSRGRRTRRPTETTLRMRLKVETTMRRRSICSLRETRRCESTLPRTEARVWVGFEELGWREVRDRRILKEGRLVDLEV